MNKPSQPVTKSDLSERERELVKLMQEQNFGRILGLPVQGGQPVLNPPPRIVKVIKMCGQNGPRPEITKDDFELKLEVRDFFLQIRELPNCVITSVEIAHGLPIKMTIEENTAVQQWVGSPFMN